MLFRQYVALISGPNLFNLCSFILSLSLTPVFPFILCTRLPPHPFFQTNRDIMVFVVVLLKVDNQNGAKNNWLKRERHKSFLSIKILTKGGFINKLCFLFNFINVYFYYYSCGVILAVSSLKISLKNVKIKAVRVRC